MLFERVIKIAEHFEGSRAKMAKTIGKKINIAQRTFEGYLNAEREHNLLPILPYILNKYQEVSRDWLYFDEGEMLADFGDIRVNRNGQRIGDLLHNVFGFAGLTDEEAAKKTGISLASLREILANRKKPSFEQIEALYLDCGINPAYLFDGNELQMYRPTDTLLQVYLALGQQGRHPYPEDIARIFDVSLAEADEFYNEWKSYRDQGRCRVLPQHWEETLRTKYGLNTGWLATGNPPVVEATGKAACRSRDEGRALLLNTVCQQLRAANATDETLQQAILSFVADDRVENSHHPAAGNGD